MKPALVVLGCGYTGSRVARLMAEHGYRVLATSRDPGRLQLPETIETVRLDTADPKTLAGLAAAPAGCLVLHSVPLVEAHGTPADRTAQLLGQFGGRPARVVYLSTTSVYGAQIEADASTIPAPATERGRPRLQAEAAVLGGPWSAMVLRPAAIYGPGRGIQAALPRGRFRLAGDGTNWVSRIHVDDLAAIACGALLSRVGGAWPVADHEPARAVDVAAFVAELTGSPMPEGYPADQLHPSRRANRRVDGTEVLERLGVTLQFPSYRIGIPRSLVR